MTTPPQLFPLGQPGQAPIVDKNGRPTPQFAQFLASINSILQFLGGKAAVATGTAANPAGTNSATQVMMGLGSAFQFTPKSSGNFLIFITCQMENNTAGDDAVTQIRWGAGAAPANGAAATGNLAGQLQALFNNANTAGVILPTTLVGYAAGQPNTTYWIDLGLAIITGGMASVFNCSFTAIEV